MKRTLDAKEPSFLDVNGVAARYNVKAATVWAWAREGKLPQPVRLTAGTSRWRVKDLEAWEEQRMAESGRNRRDFLEIQRRKQVHEARS
jgi:predicted DNA-binding transcriptional regulator AlpA